MIDKAELREILLTIEESSLGMRWVSQETGIKEAKLRSFVGNNLLTPEDGALTDEEVKNVHRWYMFGY